jgi:hypothetical protein
MKITAEICIFTNDHFAVEVVRASEVGAETDGDEAEGGA